MTSSFPAIGEVACIEIKGVDARRFAQAQLSADVDALAPRGWQWNAWLNAQGRVRALMHLADPGDGRLLAVLRGGDAEAVHAGLSRYVMRMHATLTLRRFAAFASDAVATGTAHIESGGAIVLGYGSRSLRLESAAMPLDPASRSSWMLQDIREGWPSLPAGESDFLPPALGLEHLGAVAFQKGCYPGQEIAARLHYRGGHKLRLHHLCGAQPLALGQQNDANDRVVSVLETAVVQNRGEALVVMPITDALDINILQNTYNVVSMFKA